ncbi:MAG: Flp family type IVb pilin, partial [Actinobacteria bacterium]|nr:Flp family type IVb pilin [Actinomycetota bacterium]
VPTKEECAMLKKFASLIRKEEGQALAEYGLILALIAVICIVALTLLGGNLSAILTQIANAV